MKGWCAIPERMNSNDFGFKLSVLHKFLDTLGTKEYLGISPVLLKCSLVKVLTTLVREITSRAEKALRRR